MSYAIVPIPQIDVSVRPATPGDVAFVDALQKVHRENLGFLARSWIEGKIGRGEVLVAVTSGQLPVASEEGEHSPPLATDNRQLETRLGYIISQDKYLKREELGLVVQLCVVPGRQRGFIGATLLKAAFDRAAYGCRLFCCWCAQDLVGANRFWEAMGFVPLAYRAGSEAKRRVHIFWQKRVRGASDAHGGTQWWYPTQTSAGAMGEDRIVLPIPPGKRWWDEMPVIVLPTEPVVGRQLSVVKEKRPRAKGKGAAPVTRVLTTASIGMRFGPPPPVTPVAVAKPKRTKKPKAKNDPKLVAAARELRDRWMEQVNSGAYVFEDAGKYDVARALPSPTRLADTPALLPAA